MGRTHAGGEAPACAAVAIVCYKNMATQTYGEQISALFMRGPAEEAYCVDIRGEGHQRKIKCQKDRAHEKAKPKERGISWID